MVCLTVAVHLQVLSLMLGQAGLHLHTFPEVAFRLDKWTMQGYPCVLDKTPNRQLDIHVCLPCPTTFPLPYSPQPCMHHQLSFTPCSKKNLSLRHPSAWAQSLLLHSPAGGNSACLWRRG